MSDETHHSPDGKMSIRKLSYLAVGSVGVVYGDIGTSPLYAFREALKPVAADGLTRGEVISLVSLMFWALTIIVTMKYVLFLLRADNDGEGGTLSLLALLMKTANGHTAVLMLLGLLGAALFLGDAMITPALSVLSAVEGLKLVTPTLSDYIVPISVAILALLFAIQSHGTGAVARFFGPITAIWFIVMGLAGIMHIADDYGILAALNPWYAVNFLMNEGFLGVVVLGAVFLTVTGAEALYADLGHFGRRPIQWAWFVLVFPSLTLNYLGQGALVLREPLAMSDPFFLMYPHWALLPVVILATMATIIASQAVITGAFSLTRQAIHLGFLPRMEILITSETNTGQIFLPSVNAILFFGVIFLVLSFKTSDALATAYGISVTGAMVVTSIMAFEFVRVRWNWTLPMAIAVLTPLLLLEFVFLGANLLKIHDGGYVPVLIATAFTVIMWTWRRGSAILMEKTRHTDIPLSSFVSSIERKSDHSPAHVPGTAIFLTSDPESAPAALLHNLKHNHVLHDKNVILTIRTTNKPRVPQEDRYSVEKVSDRFSRVELRFGFMESQNVSQALATLRKTGLKFDIMSTSFYLGRRKLVPDAKSGMPHWQDRLYIALANAATDPSDYFRLPANRVVELGSHVII
ncbi:potassium transporter Kup [Agrobacterium sp. SHOUNA12C]|uniref:Probable potassium transport system protein Kup n=3 Tax=Rhizobium/Agrobacterium group TaxID=227290 RepID=KUP_RHIR8|nr:MULTISPECIES: potassium transporter Kup [Rhizobium]B9JA25.1 RecName: Full=Probable potassium transport system protein Kup [Rhizobium rhizogenes K84]KAA6483717.1 potassium transporter Kup [Agrobacterium sp. ICMP 7243]MCJ9720996.1 potassium transporter Kup [Agrobacterium sp. BETTINA12B]MCJ9757609.1 potassium transporter Kup [Agrobacterium sp. SHOUNA12C]OCI98240.1 potassium transport protein Kup [Agrobacterium sp. 13-626]OCJ21966.1 potassium transport protein Kup [Agrobacterium sp. B131/95]O